MNKYDDIIGLIDRFLSQNISKAEMDELTRNIKDSDHYRNIFDQENTLWNILDLKYNNDIYDSDKAWNEINGKLQLKNSSTKSTLLIRRSLLKAISVAASIAIMLALGSIGLLIFDKQKAEPIYCSATTTVFTGEGDKAWVYLPDSSKIYLNSQSSLAYYSDYNHSNRIVDFSGEAYFEVSTNKEKPFIVRLGEMTVTATGTSFNILSYSDESRVEATLEEGIIHVNIIGNEDITLNPGQQVVYNKNTKIVSSHNVNTEIYTSWKENKLRLYDTPFEEALRKIARRYNVTFEIQNDKDILDLNYTATFIDESIEEVMEMLRTISPINYKIFWQSGPNDKNYIKPKIVITKRKT